MSRVVIDASALAAAAFREPGGEAIVRRLNGGTVFAPSLLRYELANTALKKCRKEPGDAPQILAALARVLDQRADIVWREIDPIDVALVASATGTSAYDASYLWLAGVLGADLVTLDARLARAAGLAPV